MKHVRQKVYTLLRKSEKYTKTDMVYLAKGGSWLMSGQFITTIFSLILSVAFANLLPKEVFGNYKFILSLAGIISAFTLTGIGTAVIQSVARGYEGALKTGFWIQLKWSIFIILASLTGAIYYFLNDNNLTAISLLVIGSTYPIITSSSLYSGFLTGKKNFKLIALLNIFRNVLPVILLLITVFLTQDTLVIIFVYFISNTLASIYSYLIVIKKYKPKQKTDKEMVSYGKHLSIINIISAVAMQIDKILVFHFLGAAQLAIYAFAIMIPNHIHGLFKNISVLAFPRFSQQNKFELKKSLPSKTFKLFIFSLLISILYIIFSPFIFKLIFPLYLDSIIYTQFFAINIILTGGLLISSTFIQSQKLIKETYIISIFKNILKISLLYFLIPVYGIIGAILGILIPRFISLFLSFALIKIHK